MSTLEARRNARTAATETTEAEQRRSPCIYSEKSNAGIRNLKPWAKGQSGNPKGRPKGSRHKLSEAFFAAMVEVWREKGADCLRSFAENDPAGYILMVADLVKNTPQESAQDEHWREMAAWFRAQRELEEAQLAALQNVTARV